MSARKEYVGPNGTAPDMPTLAYVRLLALTICHTIDDPQEGSAETRIADALRTSKEICTVIDSEKPVSTDAEEIKRLRTALEQILVPTGLPARGSMSGAMEAVRNIARDALGKPVLFVQRCAVHGPQHVFEESRNMACACGKGVPR